MRQHMPRTPSQSAVTATVRTENRTVTGTMPADDAVTLNRAIVMAMVPPMPVILGFLDQCRISSFNAADRLAEAGQRGSFREWRDKAHRTGA